jgi:hypothetical protein
MLGNPYLDAFLKVQGQMESRYFNLTRFTSRSELTTEYAWSIPSKEAIDCICKYSPIIEVGAGTGYWASLINSAGAKIHCYDINPPGITPNDYSHQKQYYPIQPVQWLKWEKTRNSTLFLCWPPYDDNMAIDCLKKYRGDTLIYIGEGHYGCTANDAFHNELDKNWIELEGVNLFQWDGIHDHLTIYRRK